ncbi:MAG: lipase family alpha/beta hydrolase [Cyclobacteriaceae bacterium]
METTELKLAKHSISVTVLGHLNSKKGVLLFPGYGNSIDDYAHLSNHFLNKGYTFYYFSLPTITNKNWKKTIPISLSDWNTALINYLKNTPTEKMILIGHSIGTRLALNTELPTLSIEKQVFLTPDGIYPDYRFLAVTRTLLGRFLFRLLLGSSTLSNWLIKITELILTKKDQQIITFSLSTKNKRIKLYTTWVSLCKLFFIKKDETYPSYFILAKHDQIIHTNRILKIIKHSKVIKSIVLPCSHQQLLKNFSQSSENLEFLD